MVKNRDCKLFPTRNLLNGLEFALNGQAGEFIFKADLNLEILQLRHREESGRLCLHSVLISFSCSELAWSQFEFLFFLCVSQM